MTKPKAQSGQPPKLAKAFEDKRAGCCRLRNEGSVGHYVAKAFVDDAQGGVQI